MINPYDKYRQTQVQTATPEQLVLMLYDGAVKFLLQAKDSMQANKIECTNKNLVRVQDIICELQYGLNKDAGAVSEQLDALYDYLYRRTIDANLTKDMSIIDEVVGLIRELRSTWMEAILLARRQLAAEAAGDANH